MMTPTDGHYVRALRFDWLTPAYDTVVRWTTREAAFKPALLAQAGIAPGQRLLDLACGTGTLAIAAQRAHPDASIIGLDGDPRILSIAREKADRAGVTVAFEEGYSWELPFPDAHFDRVLCSLFFHHLSWADKQRTALEVLRVLRPDGELHVADWGRPSGPLMRLAFLPVQLLDGFANTRDNLHGRLPEAFAMAGFVDIVATRSIGTPLGTMTLHRARKPS